MYQPMIPELAEAGYQVVAFDQRGYSPGARPAGAEAYAIDKLVGDVFAVADALGFDSFHLVGHDWGAVVGWRIVLEGSSRIKSWSALSIPHIGAYAAAIESDADQRRRSAYVGFFRMPWLPEMLFSFNGFTMMRNALYGSHAKETVDEYISIFSEPGALTAALNWYRASDIHNARGLNLDVTAPTAFIWGNQDPVVGDWALESQRQHFDGNLWETELDTGHWLMQTEAQAVNAAVLTLMENHR
jgi:pimeloyl-ACP methyl ester carboxylesterase